VDGSRDAIRPTQHKSATALLLYGAPCTALLVLLGLAGSELCLAGGDLLLGVQGADYYFLFDTALHADQRLGGCLAHTFVRRVFLSIQVSVVPSNISEGLRSTLALDPQLGGVQLCYRRARSPDLAWSPVAPRAYLQRGLPPELGRERTRQVTQRRYLQPNSRENRSARRGPRSS